MVPGENDSKFVHARCEASYPDLIDAGVEIYHWPGLNHGKVMVADGERSIIGSANLDGLSQNHIYEMNVVIDDASIAKKLETELFGEDLPRCQAVTMEDVTPRPCDPPWSWLGEYV